jgi:hypothetical protein
MPTASRLVSPRRTDYLSFDDELTLHQLDLTLLAFEFLRPLWDHEGWPRDEPRNTRAIRRQALRHAEHYGEGGKPARLISGPEPHRRAAALRRY